MIKDTIFAFIIKLLGTILSFFISILISRQYGAEGIGNYYIALSVLNAFLIFSKMGFDISLIRVIASEINTKKDGSILYIIKKSFLFIGMVSIIVTIIMNFLAEFISSVVFEDYALKNMIKLLSLSIIPTTLTAIIIAIIRGRSEIKISNIIESLTFQSVFIFMIAIEFSTKITGINRLLIIYVIASYITLFISIIFFSKYLRGIEYNKLSTEWTLKKIIKISIPLMVVSSMNIILSSMDTIMIGIWHGNDIVGIYGVSSKIVTISSMCLIAINSVMAPKFANLYAEGKLEELRDMVNKITIVMFCISLIFFILIQVFATQILNIYGSEFNSTTIMRILLIGQFFVLGTGPMAYLLMMTGNEKFHKNNVVASVVINIILNVVLIPKYAGIGAAIATAISLIIKNILGYIFVKRWFKSEMEVSINY